MTEWRQRIINPGRNNRKQGPRYQAILLEVGVQAVLGDPSPAVTVAADRGMSPDAVRQAVSRTRRRLRHLAEDDERYAVLAELPIAA